MDAAKEVREKPETSYQTEIKGHKKKGIQK